MKREWKPGDVALVEAGLRTTVGDWPRVALVSHRREHANPNLLEFAYATGGFDMVGDLAEGFTARPLVVIDPEDREQVERLATEFLTCARSLPATINAVADTMQAALREFANPRPPKPEEPTGLGAVVEDAEGNRWVLYTHPDNHAPWCDGSASCDYDEIAAVRVLTEGVRDA